MPTRQRTRRKSQQEQNEERDRASEVRWAKQHRPYVECDTSDHGASHKVDRDPQEIQFGLFRNGTDHQGICRSRVVYSCGAKEKPAPDSGAGWLEGTLN
jgi:hypothetical protein